MSFNLDFRAQIEGDSEIQRKIDDFVKALEDLQKAGDDVERPLSDAAKAMDDVAKSAGGVGKDISDAEQALSDISKSAGDADKALVDADKSFNDVSSSAADVAGELEEADAAFSDIANDADASVSSLDAVNSSFDSVSSAAQEAETNIQAAATGIEGIGTSTDQATSALEGMGSAFEGAGTATTTFNDVLSSTGTAAQTAAGGLEQANTLVGEFGASADSAKGATEGLTGSVAGTVGGFTAMGSIVTSTVSTLFRMEDAQLRLDKANLMVERSTEGARKAQLAFDNLLSTASSNASGVAEARGRLAEALDRLNQLENAGVRSGQEYQAAQEEVTAATAALRQEFAQGGGDVEKFDAAVNKMTLTLDKVQTSMATAEKAQRGFNMTAIELPISIAGLAGSIVQAVASADKFKDALTGVKTAITGISFASVATSITAVLLPALAAAYAGFAVLESVPSLTRAIHAAVEKDTQGMVQNLSEFLGVLERFASILPGLGGAPLKLAREALQEFAKSQGVATKEVDGSIGSLLNAEEHQKNLAEATAILTGKNTELGTSQQTAATASAQQEAAIAGIKAEIEGARAGIEGYVAGIQEQVEASGTLESVLRQTNKAMQENISQTMDLVGSTENHDNAILKLSQSYADHQVAIDQLSHTLGTAEGQMASYMNAVASGNEKFLTWVQSTRDAATESETFKRNLQGMADAMGGLPGFMQGTVEEYQAFIRANEEGGDAVKEFERMALESWRGLTSAAKPLFDDLKKAWADIFEGKTLDDATSALQAANDKIAQNVRDNEQAIATSAEGTAPKIKDIYDGVDWAAVTDAMTDPFVTAFNKLPAAVSDTLSQTEREAGIFQAKFAQTAEMAGTAWATNLQFNMGQGFDVALAEANQAAADVLAPFIQQHPETAQMFQPLFDAMNQTGPGAAQAVQQVLSNMSGMPGPVGEIATSMLTNFQTEFGGKIPGVTKAGVEGAIQEMSGLSTAVGMEIKSAIDALNVSITVEFEKLIKAINTMINNDIKQEPDSVPIITANTNPANEAIQLIGTSLDQMKAYLTANPLSIIVDTQQAMTMVQGLETRLSSMSGKNVTITVDTGPAGIAIQGLQAQLDAMAGKNVAITVDTGAAGIAITGLQGQIDAVHGTNVFITVDTGAAGIAITGIQQQIDQVHGAEVAITVDTGPAGIAIREIQGQIDNVHGTNVYITVDTSGAQAAIQQLQQQINALQSSMGGMGGGGYGGGSYYQPNANYPYYQFARGFGPAVVTRPTRMLVGEAGPEMVSVIPMKGDNQWQKGGWPQTKTAAAGMGWYGPSSGGLGYGAIPRSNTYSEAAYLLQMQQGAQQGTMQGSEQGSMQGAQQGTEQGMQQSQAGMQDAVQQGAMQGTQQGYQEVESRIQQALLAGNMGEAMAGFGHGYGFNWSGGAQGQTLGMGGGGAQYPMAPSNTEIWGAGRFTWGGGAAGAQLGGGGSGAGQYQPVGMPMGVNETIGFGSRPRHYTWTGGAMGTALTPHGPGLAPPPGGGGMMPSPFSRQATNVSTGTDAGKAASKSFVKAFDAGVEGQSQLINGVPATILSGNGGPARQAGNQAGQMAGSGFAQGFNSQMPELTSQISEAMNPQTMPSGGLKIGSPGYPKPYTGSGMPAGVTGSQLINGVAATILPGIGPRGPPMQAARGMHTKLRRDTLIQAHRNERVDISPESNLSKASGLTRETMDRITQLLERLISQGSQFKVDFNVDGRKLSSVAAKNMGVAGYGDK
jgi:hypothetical protein